MQVFDSVLARLKSAKNLYMSHRFFYKIRQIHRIFDAFRQNPPIFYRNQAPARRLQAPCTERATWRETPSTSSAFAQETQHPHEMDAGLKSLVTCTRRAPLTWGVARGCNLRIPARPTCPRPALGPLLVLVEALTSSNAGLALVNLLLEKRNNATLYGLRILSCRIHQSNVICGDQANDVQDLERTLW